MRADQIKRRGGQCHEFCLKMPLRCGVRTGDVTPDFNFTIIAIDHEIRTSPLVCNRFQHVQQC